MSWCDRHKSAESSMLSHVQSAEARVNVEGAQNISSMEVKCMPEGKMDVLWCSGKRMHFAQRSTIRKWQNPDSNPGSVGCQIYIMYLSLHFIICKMRIRKPTSIRLIQRLDEMLSTVCWMLSLCQFTVFI